MKKVLLGIVLAGVASFSFADQPLNLNKELPNSLQSRQSKIIIDDKNEAYCKMILSVAKSIMGARQAGVPIDESLEISNNIAKDDAAFFQKIGRLLVIDAYDQPKFTTEKYRTEQVNEFAAKHYISCMKAAGQF